MWGVQRGNPRLEGLRAGASSSAVNQAHPPAQPCAAGNPAREHRRGCASPEVLHKNDRKILSDRKTSVIETVVEELV